MTALPTIQDFNELIEPYLNGGHVISHQTEYLTKPGENYGATVLKITVDVKEKSGNIRHLNVVGKLPPITEFLWKLFKPEITVVKENNCYLQIDKELRQLQLECHVPEEDIIDVLPKCYGARMSLDKTASQADKNAVLLLENLNDFGYKVGDRIKGFDLEHAQLVLKNLAKFHALPIALKKLKPDVFEKKFLPYLYKFNVDSGLDPEERQIMIKATLEDVRNACGKEELVQKTKTLIDEFNIFMDKNEACADALFATVAHYDLWINNMLILKDPNNKPVKVKLIDFQIVQYDSFAHDLLFFLLISVQNDVLEEKLDSLLDYYYDHFITSFQQIGYDTTEYTKEKYHQEIKRVAPIEFVHVLLMLRVVFMKKDSISDVHVINNDIFANENFTDSTCFKKLKAVISIYEKRGWI